MITEVAKKVAQHASNNSTVLLTSVGVAGVVTTAVLAGKAAFKSAEVILEEQKIRDEYVTPATVQGHKLPPLTTKEKAQLTWMLYLPAVGSAVLTCTAVIAANRIGDKRAAAFAAAFTVSEKALVEYKSKVVETFGATKGNRVHDAVMQDHVTNTPVPQNLVIMTGNKQLCFDGISGRYFHSNMEDLKKAQNDLNHRILSDNYASLTDFYNLIGIDGNQLSDNIGWNVDKLLEISFTTCLSPDQEPAIAMDYRTEPIRGFHRLH